jgi:type I restriction enzyme S subunit
MWTLRPEHFKAITSVRPPIEEQAAIVNFVAEESRHIELATSKLERECELLIEYRTRLTSDVVTGKLDVREAAKSLPELDEAPPDLVDAPISDVEGELELAETL